jgi:gluconokinase
MSGTHVVTIDIGSSSVRALLFDAQAGQVQGFGAQLAYEIRTSPDGGAEIDPDALANIVTACLDELHHQIQRAGIAPAAVGFSAFWHSFCGVDHNGKPTLPILHLLDTRSEDQIVRVPDAHRRTGCVPHASYWPAKLLWLEKNRTSEFRATHRWLSFSEYFFLQLFGRSRTSTSMVSATGLWNQGANDYNEEMLSALPISRDQLAAVDTLDEPECDLLAEFRQRWPAFDGIPWYPAVGDGAANHIGSGCVTPEQYSLMVGTTGAMRALPSSLDDGIPRGLWCYRVDRRRPLIGGALSNGGNVLAWLKRTLVLPADLEARLESAKPGSHGLTVCPFLAGERSPYWRADLRAVIAGLSLSTDPSQIVHAFMESVALRFRAIYDLLSARLCAPQEVIASGGGLQRSHAWTQMMADALGHPVLRSQTPEASSRGVAMLALERLGVVSSLAQFHAATGHVFSPRCEFKAEYERLAVEQEALFKKQFGSTKATEE